jgi:hypothetical protein
MDTRPQEKLSPRNHFKALLVIITLHAFVWFKCPDKGTPSSQMCQIFYFRCHKHTQIVQEYEPVSLSY